MERVLVSKVLVLATSCGLLAGCSGSDALGCAPTPRERLDESSAELVCTQAGFERGDVVVGTGTLGTEVVEVTAAGRIRKVGPAAASDQPSMDNWWDIYKRAGDDSPIYAPHQPESLLPLESLCGKTTLLSDGRWALGLRNDRVAGWYVGSNSRGFQRVGRPTRDVAGMFGYPIGRTWVVIGNSGGNSYCEGFRPYEPRTEDDSVLTGNSVQIVAPDIDPLVFIAEDEWRLGLTRIDRTGTCAFHQDDGSVASIYDLTTGTATELASFRSFQFLR